jgi:hypothetical protein
LYSGVFLFIEIWTAEEHSFIINSSLLKFLEEDLNSREKYQ